MRQKSSSKKRRAPTREKPKKRFLSAKPPVRRGDMSKEVEVEVARIPLRWRKRYIRAMTGRSRQTAIWAFCDMCMGYQKEACEHTICPLFKYRPGVRK